MGKDIMAVPEGTFDLLETECRIIKKLKTDINKVFDDFGYFEVMTPTLEFYDTFNRYEKGIKQEEMYKFFDNNGKILSLRVDGTIPIARVVSTKLRNSKLPLKIRYSSKVFRLNEMLVGKKNEFLDCGIEFIGGNTFEADVEILLMAVKALKKSGIKDFKIELGHIGIFKSIWNSLNIDEGYREKLSYFIEHKRLVELYELLSKINISKEDKKVLKALPWLFGGKEVLDKAKTIIENKDVLENINYLDKLYNGLKFLGYEDYLIFDLGTTPKIDYYSGIIFKGYIKGSRGYVLHGGRYDNLIKGYGRDAKASGFSININELMSVINKDSFLEVEEKINIYYNKENFLEKIKDANDLVKKGNKILLLEEENL